MSGPAILSESSSAPATSSGDLLMCPLGLPRRRRPGADPYRGRNKPASQKEANRAHAQLRSPGERANAQLKTWHILRKLRCCPWQAGQLAKAFHVRQARQTER